MKKLKNFAAAQETLAAESTGVAETTGSSNKHRNSKKLGEEEALKTDFSEDRNKEVTNTKEMAH